MNTSYSAVSAYALYKKSGLKAVKTKHKRKLKAFKADTFNKEKQSALIEVCSGEKITNIDSLESEQEHEKESVVLNNVDTKPIALPNNTLKGQKRKAAIIKTGSTKAVKLHCQELNFDHKSHLTFEWLVSPIRVDEFFKTWWEKSAVIIKRNCVDYYQDLLTTEILDGIIRTNPLFYTQNIDVVSYENGKRETHNQEGRAYPAVLWDYYKNGCSIRVLNPHTYCPKLHSLLATLQEYFGCMAGVNAYLTPPGSQGFAPHYDDIEAFVLQLEGRKHWNLYAPLTESEVLPRHSSKNFDRSELKKPIKQLTLETGDLLYFPRGVIHEGFTDSDSHSLHITISVYQKTAYVDLLEHALKSALNTAVQMDPEYRKGLPLQYLKQTGLMNFQTTSSTRDEIVYKVKQLISKLTEYVSVDTAADQLGKQFMWDAVPPVPSTDEKSCMVHENSDRIHKGVVHNQVGISLDIKVRLLRYHCLRVVAEEDTDESIRIYYCTDNAKYYHGFEQQFLVLDKTLLPALKCLLHNYPKFVQVRDIPLDNDDSKMQIVSDLWERGLLVTETPLEVLDE